MKLSGILFFSLFYIVSYSQEIRHDKPDNSCEAGVKEAKADIEKGIYKVLSYGLIMRPNQEFHDYYVEFVREKYNVILGDGGCVVSDKTDCYTETMQNAVLEKFGQDFFERIQKEAHKIFDTQKNPE